MIRYFGFALIIAACAATWALAQEQSEHYSEAGADTCLGCHNDPSMLAIFDTAHGQQADPAAPMASLQCEACHGPAMPHTDRRQARPGHQPVINFGIDADTPLEEQTAACTGCHQSDIGHEWLGSAHERNEGTCASCHTSHASRDPVLAPLTQNDTCFGCHTKQHADSRKPSSHPLRTDDPIRVAAMACTDCHDPHSGTNEAQLVRETLNDVCFECHAQFRGPVLFEHAPVTEDCGLCHEPHGSIHGALLTQRAPLLCQSCHSQAGHPSISFTDETLPGGTPSSMTLGSSCLNCHSAVHGSNHPSGFKLMR